MQRSTNRNSSLISFLNPKSPVSEAYRSLKTNITFSSIDSDIQTIMVTSSSPNEGKSTTAINLAIMYSQSDNKVLLIDADMRKPTLHQMFLLSNRVGVSSLLSKQTQLIEVIQETQVPGLNVITSGPIPPNPAEMLGSQRMVNFLDEVKEMYDVIIIDTPPVLAVTDAVLVSNQCDGTLIVVNAGKIKRNLAIKMKAKLEQAKAKILGVVLNNVKLNESSGYYYYYGNNE